jgi:hypothetical protein
MSERSTQEQPTPPPGTKVHVATKFEMQLQMLIVGQPSDEVLEALMMVLLSTFCGACSSADEAEESADRFAAYLRKHIRPNFGYIKAQHATQTNSEPGHA